MHIYTYVSLCEYTSSTILFAIFWLDWFVVFVSIQNNSFDINSDKFYLLKIQIYELLPFNIQQRSVQQSTIYVHILWRFKKTEHVQKRVVLCSFCNCCCLYECGNFKREWNSVVTIRSKRCWSFFLRNITVWNYLLGNLFKIKLPEIWLYFCMTVSACIEQLQTEEWNIVLKCTIRRWKIWDKSAFNKFYMTYKFIKDVDERISTIQITWQCRKNKKSILTLTENSKL